MIRTAILIGAFTLIGGFIILHLIDTNTSTTSAIDSLRFSNTQTWDQEFLDALHAPSGFPQSLVDSIVLPPPPSNRSTTTANEIAYLHTLVPERTPEKVAQIEDEMSTQTTVYSDVSYETIIGPHIRPHTSKFIDYMIERVGPIIFAQKQKYDRVRPSFIDPTLTTVIDIPNHPAYPSGHAVQSYLIAVFLSELDPQNTERYFASAERIRKNREVAGVHYPSDSEAGVLLAQQLVPILRSDPNFNALFDIAKTEWGEPQTH